LRLSTRMNVRPVRFATVYALARVAPLAAAFAAAACAVGQTGGDPIGSAPPGSVGGASAVGGNTGVTGGATSPGTLPATSTPNNGLPGGAGTTTPVAVPIAHLTVAQYNNTVQDLFAPVQVPAQNLPSDSIIEGFDNNASAQSPSAPLLDAYNTAATAIATAAMATPAALLGCTPAARADEDACANTFFATFVPKAFRRPVTAAELTNLTAFYTASRTAGYNFNTTMTLAIEALLQSSSFLYRVEIGTPIAGTNTVQLTNYEMANRLSYFLWNTMPDATLFAAAASGALATPDGIETQTRRMLSDPRAHTALVRFHAEWLNFDAMDNMSKDPTLFPTFTPDMGTAMRQSAEQFIDGIFFGGGTLSDLLTDSHAWINDTLAPLYGLPAPGSAQLSLVAVDPTQRAGILTNAGLMAGLAHQTADAPVLRGVFVLGSLMCAPPPPPPANVNASPPTASTTVPTTTRELYADTHEQGSCAGCHHTIDGIGFSFEHYDALGQWRTTDNGSPVDSSGWFTAGATDLSGNISDAVDLAHKLAASTSVQACVVSQWIRYALGVDHTGVDLNAIGPLVDAFVAKQLNLTELVVALAKSDTFRTRLVSN